MKRRKFLKLTGLAAASVMTHQALSYYSFQQNELIPMQNVSIELSHFGLPLKIHGIVTGGVKVKSSHKNRSLGIAQILLDPFWTDWLPIYVWVIEHPEGIILIDTGENAKVKDADYFKCNPTVGWVNKKILRFNTSREEEIDIQLESLGIKTDEVRWVVLTHLHLDHVDGLHHFPKSEILISKTDFQQPAGGVRCLLPKWLKPHLIQHNQNEIPHFSGAFSLTAQQDIWLVPTPGHTYGHQSVLLRGEQVDILFAGDVAFSQQQLIKQQVAGICTDKKAVKTTYQTIQDYAKKRPLVFLPSHDLDSGKRLQGLMPFG